MAYEQALQANDEATLESMFHDSPETVRFGPTENLFGAEAIKSFRRNRKPVDLARKVDRMECLVLDADHGIVNLCFTRIVAGESRLGRQSQVWKRFGAAGWKVVSAHVSYLEEPRVNAADDSLSAEDWETYVRLASQLAELPIADSSLRGVVDTLRTTARVAKPLLAFDLPEGSEMAPVFNAQP
ncbi:MAG: AtzH-like domain-containing protein [Opitutales bacterium]